uniref:Uncharacterized protein n=1 Tax=Triticum urartu TaxID=4572 RepID=A0A8R7V7P8_TRIUA
MWWGRAAGSLLVRPLRSLLSVSPPPSPSIRIFPRNPIHGAAALAALGLLTPPPLVLHDFPRVRSPLPLLCATPASDPAPPTPDPSTLPECPSAERRPRATPAPNPMRRAPASCMVLEHPSAPRRRSATRPPPASVLPGATRPPPASVLQAHPLRRRPGPL